jgi:Fe2+ or Zn2+ uptake regulation protein
MSRPPHDVAAELRAAGLAPTAQRRAVLDALEGREHPATAQDIHALLRANNHRVSVTTVYRALAALAEAGLVHVFALDGERAYRHCATTPHQHLLCESCGLVQEYPSEPAHQLLAAALADRDFTPDPQHTDVHGLCGACRRGAPCHHRPDRAHQERTTL